MLWPESNNLLSRRQMLQSASCGFGFLALAGLLSRSQAAEPGGSLLAARAPHFTPRAKRIIFMFMAGAPSHVDTFDYKPQLAVDDGKEGGGRGKGRKLMKSPFKFSQHGQSGLWFPETLPNLAQHADAFFNREHRILARIPQSCDDQLVDQPAAPGDQVEMPIRDRIECTWIDRDQFGQEGL